MRERVWNGSASIRRTRRDAAKGAAMNIGRRSLLERVALASQGTPSARCRKQQAHLLGMTAGRFRELRAKARAAGYRVEEERPINRTGLASPKWLRILADMTKDPPCKQCGCRGRHGWPRRGRSSSTRAADWRRWGAKQLSIAGAPVQARACSPRPPRTGREGSPRPARVADDRVPADPGGRVPARHPLEAGQGFGTQDAAHWGPAAEPGNGAAHAREERLFRSVDEWNVEGDDGATCGPPKTFGECPTKGPRVSYIGCRHPQLSRGDRQRRQIELPPHRSRDGRTVFVAGSAPGREAKSAEVPSSGRLSHEEVSEHLGLTAERTRQIEGGVLEADQRREERPGMSSVRVEMEDLLVTEVGTEKRTARRWPREARSRSDSCDLLWPAGDSSSSTDAQ